MNAALSCFLFEEGCVGTACKLVAEVGKFFQSTINPWTAHQYIEKTKNFTGSPSWHSRELLWIPCWCKIRTHSLTWLTAGCLLFKASYLENCIAWAGHQCFGSKFSIHTVRLSSSACHLIQLFCFGLMFFPQHCCLQIYITVSNKEPW